MHVSSEFFEQPTQFPRIPCLLHLHHTPQQQPASEFSARRTFLVFRNLITDHTPYVAEFSILAFILDYGELCVCVCVCVEEGG